MINNEATFGAFWGKTKEADFSRILEVNLYLCKAIWGLVRANVVTDPEMRVGDEGFQIHLNQSDLTCLLNKLNDSQSKLMGAIGQPQYSFDQLIQVIRSAATVSAMLQLMAEGGKKRVAFEGYFWAEDAQYS